MKGYVDLFLVFLKMGCVTFGGGYAMVPVIERELIKKRGWTTMEEVMDYYTVAQVTPGIIAVNTSTFIGYKQKGPLGGILATFGFVFPGVTMVTVIALCLSSFAEYPAVQHAFAGIRVAVGALILDTVIKLVRGVFKDSMSVLLFGLSFALSAALSVNPVFLVLASGIAGFLLYGRPGKKGGAA
jgi:chromate transporter